LNIAQIADADRKRVTCGNDSAADFLKHWSAYVHGIDDIIDESPGPESILETFMLAAFVYTHPFFVANMVQLRQIAVNCTNAYADTVMWEKSDEAWRKNFSDHYRHFGAEMVIAVAALCGGYHHARMISPALRELCWREHHNEKGEVT